MSKSDYLENALFDGELGGSTWSKPANVHFALHTGVPGDTGANEVSATGYVRKQMTNNATNFPNASGGQKQNGTEIAFSEAQADYGEVIAMSYWDAATTGNMHRWGYLVDTLYPMTALAATDVLTAPGHPFVDGTAVRLTALPGVALPGGLSEGTKYFVRDTLGNTFKLAATQGGAAINITSDGGGQLGVNKSRVISEGITPRFAASSLTFIET